MKRLILTMILSVCLPCAVFADTYTIYANTNDCNISAIGTGGNWSGARNATTGTVGETTSASATLAFGSDFSSGFNIYGVYRVFLEFDLSALSGNARSAKLYLRRKDNTAANGTCYVQKGTQASPPVAADFNNFSGSYYSTVAWGTPDDENYRELVFNTQGIADVTAAFGGTFKICVRDNYDYNNSAPNGNKTNGMYFANATGTDYDPYLEVVTGALTLDETTSDLVNNRIIAEDDDETATIPVGGTYDFTLTGVEYQIFRRDTSAIVKDWTALGNESLSSPNWSGTVTIPTTDAWLGMRFRASNDYDAAVESTENITVGVVIGCAGQSRIDFWFDWQPCAYTKETAPSTTKKWRHASTMQYDGGVDAPAYTGWQDVTGDGAVNLATLLHSALGKPIGLLDYGMGGSGLLEAYAMSGGNYWLGTSGALNCYEDFQDAMAAIGSSGRRKCNYIIWSHGYTDAYNGVTQVLYYNGLGTLFAAFQTDTNYSAIPIFIVGEPRIEPLLAFPGGDAGMDAVRMAEIQKADVSLMDNYYLASTTIDVSMCSEAIIGKIHMDDTGQMTDSTRAAQSILHKTLNSGNYTYSRGPRCTSFSRVDSTHTDIHLIHDGGTDITPTTGITGFKVKNGASWLAATGARLSPNTIRLTHASATVSLVSCLSGVTPTITGIVKDNTALELPIEPNTTISEEAGQVYIIQ